MAEKKRSIAFFVHCFPPAKGGVEFLSGQMKEILDQEYNITVITGKGVTLDSYKTFSHYTNEPIPGVHRLELAKSKQRWANRLLNKVIFKLPYFSPYYFGPLLEFTPEVEEIIANADVIIGFAMPTYSFYSAYLYAEKYNKRLILLPAYHNVPYYNNCGLFQQAFDYASSIINLSNVEKKDLTQHYTIDEKKFSKLVFSPYSQEEISTQEKKLPAIIKMRQNRLKEKVITLGYVGQITKRKNLSIIREFLDTFSNQLELQKFTIKVILAGAKTNSSPEVEHEFKKYIANKTVRIEYDFKDKDKIFDQIDIFINPSLQESLGIVNFEAFYHGLPVLVPTETAFAEFMRKKTYWTEEDILKDVLTLATHPDEYSIRVYEQFETLHTYNKNAFADKLYKLSRSSSLAV